MNWLTFREPVSAWTHFAWMVLAIPATWALWRFARDNPLKQIGLLVFGFTLTFCYAGSWLFHSVPRGIVRPFHTMDHIGIYLLIAGTETPIALIVLRGMWRIGLLSAIWAFALTGIALRLSVRLTPGQLTILYIVMGWIGILAYFELARNLSHARMRPLWIGGLFYSVGALCNSLDWPRPYPGIFGSHEIFHLFVMAGSVWHWWFLRSAVLPFEPVVEMVPMSISRQERVMSVAMAREVASPSAAVS